MIYTENDKCKQTYSPPLDGKLLQLVGKSSGWSQFPHLEKKYSRLKVTLLPRGREESHIKKGGAACHMYTFGGSKNRF